MDLFLPDWLKNVLMAMTSVVIVLGFLALRMPHVRWLQVFRLPVERLPTGQRERLRKTQNQVAGLQLILLGLVLLPGYLLLCMMTFFNTPSTTGLVLVGAASVACIGLGLYALITNH